ncbi:hypothetical protein RZS28_09290 [Methylocapsa polymorpha]|uniref:Uncharacterized protein n=1 Tax=Methylocapsa polymorpha TaxID=3080828 RepID=A0ABZ0HQ46_9HYPH|nr:hypothetical protein RZS28_09290 [Methylocapsa sp. RX1]
MASPFDLVSLVDLKAWLDVAGTGDDVLLTELITQISRAILNVLDRPSILPGAYTETLDGANNTAITLRQWPVNTILACSVNGALLPPSPSLKAGSGFHMGYVLEPPDVAPPGCMQRLSLRRRLFTRGVQNVEISYSAGYQINGENALVPANAPYIVAALAPYGDWRSDGGVAYGNGVSLAPVTANPTIGQYAVASGVYTFASADAGATVKLTYGYVPADLAVCCIDWAAERYAYRSRIGQQSKSLGGQETMAFIVKDTPDFVASLLQPYRRVVTP